MRINHLLVIVPAMAFTTIVTGNHSASAARGPAFGAMTVGAHEHGDRDGGHRGKADGRKGRDRDDDDHGKDDDDLGPKRNDFVDIRGVRPDFRRPRLRDGGSGGTFISRCGRNENEHYNSDNFIAAPGVRNGAQHLHDYVGNESTDGDSDDESLKRADTTCENGDKSTYYWPVLRLRGQRDDTPQARQSEKDGNVGRPLTPASVTLRFSGNPRDDVREMPRFLRMITGDAKAKSGDGEKARAQWTCTGFGDRRTEKYPLCPPGSRVARVLDFPSCWDGENTDSADHRSHVVFPKRDGKCDDDFKPIPHLEYLLTYDIPRNRLFALDGFPSEKHSPITDHGDFVNVMPDGLMRRATDCINNGQNCS
ncbi:DUF1996 domain-containing protein [Actinomadura decatromicini]|uniref:DUF1996 domain-containing protein n=1 Tax=Actinomadura decatromicini TaxID=2604572 RepID=A0A5D3F5H4_9ACTN|nr:DUF1996 domain-containing protein [Actinomadura decatromicini]TYK43056.1 DUF1996 domain-containing protein [Actinomadura decatromicini]